MTITWAQALGWRLGRHLLDPVGEVSAADVVRRLGAVLAMDERLADLAVAARSTTAQPGDLARALVDGSVVKVYSYRGATHFMAPEDAGLYLAMRAAGKQWLLKSWVDFYELGPDDWPDFRAAVRDALSDGPLTVGEIGEVLVRDRRYRHLRPVFEDGAGTLVKPLTWQGDMSFGPPRDGRATFQRLDTNPRWAGIPDLEEAGPRAISAYLRTYGPVTREHVHHWFGSGLSAGKKRLDRWLDAMEPDLAAVDVEGTTAYVMGDDLDDLMSAEPSTATVQLPGHDQWIMGVGTQDEHVTPPAMRDLMTRKAHPVVTGGVVTGTWTPPTSRG